MKISQEEIDAATNAWFKAHPANSTEDDVRDMLEAAYRVRKARKKAAREAKPVADIRPQNCRFRLQDEGKPYPRSSCTACGRSVMNGLGTKFAHAEREAALRKLYSEPTKEFHGVSG